MTRIILLFGALSGAITIGTMTLGMVFGGESGGSEFVGYLIMLVALSLIFVGVKRYRDVEQGGVIRFWKALQVGLGIAVVAGVVYVVGWELFLWQTDYAFFEEYSAAQLAAREAAGATAAELEALKQEMADAAVMYANPVYRMPITFTEIFPVGALVSLVSAALLRNAKLLPANA
ncbi:MAG: DUF4199 domain-containing protein [Pseudomonadota bacterium]